MQKKTCPNGHVYDPAIYGDHCPLCPAGTQPMGGHSGPATHLGGAPQPNYGNPNSPQHTYIGGGAPQPQPQPGPQHTVVGHPGGAPQPQRPDASGATNVRSQGNEPRGGGHTVIRRPGAPGQGQAAQQNSRKLVGFLVSYNRDPNGKAYQLYEGRNYIGRDGSCDISIPDDTQMSGRHMSILYRNVDKKFKFRDEQSSNGTFVNKELIDEGELQNYDIIRLGGTLFVFIAIPDIS